MDHSKEFQLGIYTSIKELEEILNKYDLPLGFDKWILKTKAGDEILIYTNNNLVEYLVSPDTLIESFSFNGLAEFRFWRVNI